MKRNGCRGLLGGLLIALTIGFSPTSEQQARVRWEQEPQTEETKVFVTYRTPQGALSRELPPTEAAQLRERLNAATKQPAETTAKASIAQQTSLKFTLTTTAQLDNAPQAKAALLRAIAKWESMIETPITVLLDVDFGPTLFGGQFPSANTLAVTTVRTQALPYLSLSTQLRDRTEDLQQRSIYDALPADSIVTDTGVPLVIQLPTPLAAAAGVLIPGFNRPHLIGINANGKFDFDPRDGIEADKLDFEALVMREIGRTLGFISKVGELEFLANANGRFFANQDITIWDLFRFRDEISLSTFGTATRAQLSGGSHVFFAGGSVLPLSTGRPDGKGGDDRPAAHWKDDQLTGQYLGIMDPTFLPGERADITANDLTALDYLGFKILPDAPVSEVISNDDNSAEETLALEGALVVNRLLPARHPFTLQSVRVQLPAAGASPVGQSLRVIAFADPARSGRPQANPTLLVDRTITIPALPESRLLEILLPNAPAINAGDLYVGVQTSANVQLAGDTTITQPRSFISKDNGGSFQMLQTAAQQPVNVILRAVTTAKLSARLSPRITALSPYRVAIGSPSQTMNVYGQDFYGIELNGIRGNSIVRWNGQDRPTEYTNGSLLQAGLYDTDLVSAGTARVTVFTPTGVNAGIESAPVEVVISANQPIPSLAAVQPSGAPPGEKTMTVKLRGDNFSPNSVVRWQGNERRPRFNSSTELDLSLTESDLANVGQLALSVFTPGPGGGASQKALFTIAPCQYKLSLGDQGLSAAGSGRGIFVDSPGYCPWTATSNAPWLVISGLSGTSGRGFFNFGAEANYTATPRAAEITVGNTKITVRQSGFAQTLSAASFTAPVAPESIASVFSLGLADAVDLAATTPLPTRLNNLEIRVRSVTGTERLAPLFFVSPDQINYQIPAGTNPGTATVFVNGVTRGPLTYGTVQVAAIAPGLFTANANGQGVPAAVALRIKADGSQSYEPVAEFSAAQNRFVPRPLDLGAPGERVFLLLFGTGIRGRSSLDAVSIKVGDQDANVSFAGAQGGFAGLDQINVELPASLRGRGEVSVNCAISGRQANTVTLSIK